MAEGFMKEKIKQKNLNLKVESAGISKIPFVHPLAIEVMKEKGIDISNNRTKGIEEFDLREFD